VTSENESGTNAAGADPPVTVFVSRRAKAGREAEFEDFIRGIIAAASEFPGHLGATVFRPTSPDDREYRVVFKFDHLSNLRHWEQSDERRSWYERSREFAEDEPRIERITGLESWFTLEQGVPIVPPPRYKMALVTWLAVFPAITLVLLALTPVVSGWPLPLRTLLLTVILVPALTWVVMPRLTRLLRRWLYPAPKNDGSA
jgi:uncharacterized protein